MAYPPPPGTHNLPAKPPAGASAPVRSAFKPAFSAPSPSPQSYARGPQAYPGAAAPPPTSASPSSYAAAPTASYGPSYSSYPGAAAGPQMSRPAAPSYSSYQQQSQPPPPQQQQQQSQPGYGPQSYGPQSYGAAPQIRNPFPMPSAGGASDYDPEMAAQIAQWQSAYLPKEVARDRDGKPIPTTDSPKTEAPPPPVVAAADSDRKKTVAREGGGKKWADDSLLDWDPSHLRLFVGNLAGETTDESLLKAFSRWKSVEMARVIRDKRSTKSKGYGFVSFSDADDFFQAAKEMDGKYIQSHPVRISKAKTEVKATNVKEKDRGGKKYGKNKKGNYGGSGGGGGGGGGYEPHLGAMSGSGVTKPGQKTKNGLRLLG